MRQLAILPLCLSIAFSLLSVPAQAADKALEVFPASILIKGKDDHRQMVVMFRNKEGMLEDVTNSAVVKIVDGQVARVQKDGRVFALKDGKTELVITHAGQEVRVPVQASSLAEELPINFVNQVVPVFTKLGCNAGGCHGKSGGQNGFRLSLLGYEPELDYQTVVKEGRGRRLFPAAPEQSLFLQKAVGSIPHGGGKKLEKDSDEYKLIHRWIATGMPYGTPKDPVVTRITVFPEIRVMGQDSRQQLSVTAHYSDGSSEDITRRAQYESNEAEVATVDTSGLIQSNKASGEAGIMIRYQGHVAVVRATVPLGQKIPAYQFPVQTIVDQHILNKFKQIGLVPSELSSDEVFLRRLMVDLTGTLPTPEEVAKFLADKDPQKRTKLVDQLLTKPEYAFLFANKWADILKVKRNGDTRRAPGTYNFHQWLVQSFTDDLPYDQFIRAIIASSGDETTHPPVVWYKEERDLSVIVDDTSQVFLGQRMACANCHHHPYEKWSQDDYWGMASFFGRMVRKQIPRPNDGTGSKPDNLLRVYVKRDGGATNKRTNQPALTKALDTEPVKIEAGEDPRQKLVDWMVSAKNPFVAKAVVNRYWAHFMGRGIVDPIDDMRVTNPPTNPELLDALANDFVKNGYSLKHLIKTIVNSRTYQLSAVPNEFNKTDKQNYSRFYPRRMSAEVLMDAISQVTDSPSNFAGMPQDNHGPRRALMLPDENHGSYFLEVFGKPSRTSSCECERTNDSNLAQALHLLNSDEVLGKISRPGSRAEKLSQDKRDDKEKLTELFVWCYARKPTDAQMNFALEHLKKNAEKPKKQVYEDLLWSLVYTKEFMFLQ